MKMVNVTIFKAQKDYVDQYLVGPDKIYNSRSELIREAIKRKLLKELVKCEFFR